MKEFRLAVVGLGHRGRAMFEEVCRHIDGV